MVRMVDALYKILRIKTHGKEEIRMAKKKVSFNVKDGATPTRHASGAFNLRVPMEFKLMPNQEYKLKLGLSCDKPVHLIQIPSLRDAGVVMVDGVWAMHDAGEEICVKLRNETPNLVLFDYGQVVARCVVIDNSDIDTV